MIPPKRERQHRRQRRNKTPQTMGTQAAAVHRFTAARTNAPMMRRAEWCGVRDAPSVRARPSWRAKGRMFNSSAMPSRDQMGMRGNNSGSLEDEIVKNSAKIVLFRINVMTHPMTANAPTCVSDKIFSRVSLSRRERIASQVSMSPSMCSPPVSVRVPNVITTPRRSGEASQQRSKAKPSAQSTPRRHPTTGIARQKKRMFCSFHSTPGTGKIVRKEQAIKKERMISMVHTPLFVMLKSPLFYMKRGL